MKIRSGFVSNSSSSSFVIWSKEPLTTELLVKKLAPGLETGSVGWEILTNILGCFVSNAEKSSVVDFIHDRGWDLDDQTDEIKRFFLKEAQGFTLYEGYVSDECGGLEASCCDARLNYEGPDLIIEHEGGY
jgi:hypothetical protein